MIYIGIDPDTQKSGVCYYRTGAKMDLYNLDFWSAIKFIETVQNADVEYKVIIEGGWLNKKSNWHAAQGRAAEKIAKNVGMNHQVGILIAEYCEHNGIPYEVVKPTKSKVNAKTFKSITGYEGRTNQETRDAAMLVFGRKKNTLIN
jgi:antitoxin component of RelBE/YafQ-DinJ toxin-antitoxin module